jgi:hypothetical protein
MMTEVQYRNFDDLLDSVKIDLRGFDLEGMIDAQQLLKVAIRVNYELGLKVNLSRSKAIEIHKGKGKLPNDFYVLNFALLCEGRNVHDLEHPNKTKTYTEGLLEGAAMGQEAAFYALGNVVQQQTIIQTLTPGVNNINHSLDSQNLIVQAIGPDDTLLSFNLLTPTTSLLQIISDAPVNITNAKIIIMASRPVFSGVNSAVIEQDQDGNHIMAYNTPGRRYTYNVLTPMRIQKSKSVSPDCINLNSNDWHTAVIKNGFLVTNFDEGVVYVNYQSLMEDDEGNLMVMDHPIVNEFYEYALKQRIYENLYMSGENVANFMQLVEQRLRAARNNALSFINTPDFRELQQVWEMNRKAQYHKYYNMFKS